MKPQSFWYGFFLPLKYLGFAFGVFFIEFLPLLIGFWAEGDDTRPFWGIINIIWCLVLSGLVWKYIAEE